MKAQTAGIDDAQLAALSRRLGIPARQLLIAAARLAQAEPQRANDAEFRRRVVDDAKRGSVSADMAARLLLTPVAAYSIDELEHLFSSIWPVANRGQDE